MAKKNDATLKRLINLEPDIWAEFFARKFHMPMEKIVVLDTDLSTSVQADKVFLMSDRAGKMPTIIHLELEAHHRLGIPEDLMRYNVLIAGRHHNKIPVRSILLLLRPIAEASDQTGTYEQSHWDAADYIRFRYNIVRLWQEPFEELLKSGPGLMPLAMLTDEALADVPEAYRRFEKRLQQPDVTTAIAREVRSAMFFLSGLRDQTQRLLELLLMKDSILEASTTYQNVILKGKAEGIAEGKVKGKAEGTLELIERLGLRMIGKAKQKQLAKLRAIRDAEHLMRIADRLPDATSWDDLLATE